MTKKVKEVVKKVAPKFAVELKMKDEVYKATGSTIIKALESIKQPDVLLHTGILSLKSGKKEVQTTLLTHVMRRFFVDETSRMIIANQMEQLLNE